TVYFPVNLIGNLYVSNGMSAGNTLKEARRHACGAAVPSTGPPHIGKDHPWLKLRPLSSRNCATAPAPA
ncbi:YcaO-like family protein, partial [Sphingopyxis sp.]|uniref:YcaO-like family protein n=1 Tax=Sphingopyxis sp. TaxID=1908224 RepID=UPI001D7C2F19